MSPPVLLRHPSSLEHDTGPHPEQPARITAIERELSGRDWLGYEVRESPVAGRELLEAVHPARYITAIEEFCAAGGGAIDMDTIVSRGSYEAALHAAGGAAALVDELVTGGAPGGRLAAPAARATTRRPPRRWASACSTTSPSPRATRSTRTASGGS